MMEFLFILLMTLLLVALLVPLGGYRTHHGAGLSIALTMLFFFLIIFPLLWAASAWITWGPTIGDVDWVPILIVGALLALLIAALMPRGTWPDTTGTAETTGSTASSSRPGPAGGGRSTTPLSEGGAYTEPKVRAVFGAFFILFLLLTFGLIIAASLG